MHSSTKRQFCLLWHHRSTTGSDGALVAISGGAVCDFAGENLLSLVRAAERALAPAVSTPRLAASRLHLETLRSEARIAPEAQNERIMAVRRGVVLGEPEDFPLETLASVLFVADPPEKLLGDFANCNFRKVPGGVARVAQQRTASGKECLAEAAATMQHGFSPDPPEVDRAFQAAVLAFEREEHRRLGDKAHVAWKECPSVKWKHSRLPLRESARLVEVSLMNARESKERAMARVVQHQVFIVARYRTLVLAAREAGRVLSARPCRILDVFASEDLSRLFAAFLDPDQAVRLRRSCRALLLPAMPRTCEASWCEYMW